MKKYLFLLLLALFSGNLHAQSRVKFFKGSFEEAKKLAKNQKKYIFISFSMNRCPSCKLMHSEAFLDEEISGIMNAFFVNMHFNVDIDDAALNRTYNFKRVYPANVLIDSTGDVVDYRQGYPGIYRFLEQIETDIEKLPYGKFFLLTKNAFLKNKTDFSQMLTYVSLRKKLGILNDNLIDEIVEKTPVSELKQMKYQLFLCNYALKTEGKTFDFILEHRDWGLFQSKLKQLIAYNFNVAVENDNKLHLKRVLKANARIIKDPSVSDEKNELLTLDFYRKTKDDDGYQETATALMKKYYLPKLKNNSDAVSISSTIKIQEMATYALDSIKKETHLEAITGLMYQACQKLENIELLSVYGQLLFRLKDDYWAKKSMYKALELTDYAESIALILDKMEGFKIERKRHE